MGLEYLLGKMVGSTSVNGKKENNMEKAALSIKKARKEKANGLMGKDLDGWMRLIDCRRAKHYLEAGAYNINFLRKLFLKIIVIVFFLIGMN